MSQRAYAFFFTKNNPTGELDFEVIGAVFACYQKEVGSGGTPHFQGILKFKFQKSVARVRTLMPGCHIEIMKGSIEDGIHYCTKPVEGCECKHCKDCPAALSSPIFFGERPVGQGKRCDLDEVKAMIDSGKSEVEIANSAFGTWCRNYRAFSRYRVLTGHSNRDFQTQCLVYWGPTGTGKSRHAQELGGSSQYWLPPPEANGSVWWDGYDGQETVVIDEFYGWIRRDILQRILDRYPYQVQTKGGAVPFVAKRVIITSNQDPTRWYKKIGLGPALERRMEFPNGFVFFFGPGVEPRAVGPRMQPSSSASFAPGYLPAAGGVLPSAR